MDIATLELRPMSLDEKEKNTLIDKHPNCRESLEMSIDFYQRVGFVDPWIGYFAFVGDTMVGTGGFKGAPKNNQVEIAYGTFPEFESAGIGTSICERLTQIALKQYPPVRIMARTLPDNNASAGILRRNQYNLLGTVFDEDDGNVWEWEYFRD